MRRDSIYNPACEELPEGWEPSTPRKHNVEKSALIIKFNNPVYTKDGYKIDDDELDDIKCKVTLIMYDIPTRYYLTDSGLWIFEECLEIDKSTDEENQSFHVPITVPSDCLYSRQIASLEFDSVIVRTCSMTYSSFIQMLQIISLVTEVDAIVIVNGMDASQYSGGMSRYIFNIETRIRKSCMEDILECIFSEMRAPAPLKLIPMRYIMTPFEYWSTMFRQTSAVVLNFKQKLNKLQMMYSTINSLPVYDEIMTKYLDKVLRVVLAPPAESLAEIPLCIDEIDNVLKECVKLLESEFWTYYAEDTAE